MRPRSWLSSSWSAIRSGSVGRCASPGAVATAPSASSPGRPTVDAWRSRRRSIHRGSSWAGSRRSTDADAGRAPTGSSAAADDTPIARRITRTDWRWDEEGHVDRWSHLFVHDGPLRVPARQVTAGDWGVSQIAWHPDSRTIAFTADRGPDADTRPRQTIWAVDVPVEARDGSGGAAGARGRAEPPPTAEPREVMAPGGWANHAAWSADGRWLAGVGVLESDPLDDISPGILLGPADGSRPPHALAPDLDRPIGNWVDTDLNGWMVSGRSGPFWVDDHTLVATVSDRGRSHPRTFTIDPESGRSIHPPTSIPADDIAAWPASSTHTLAVSGTGVVAALGTLGTRAMELMTHDIDQAGRSVWTTRTTFGSAWQRRYDDIEMRSLLVPGAGGPIETWVASPPGAGDAALPTVVDIHGGPLGAWAPAPHVEVLLLAAHGYRVVLPNIRGSATYGREWIRPQLGDWGGVDAADVHAAIDHVVDLGLADPDRLGVMGLSYGGFMVNWLVGTTDRFRAAVSENGVTNQISDWANSDGGPEFVRAALMGDPLTERGLEISSGVSRRSATSRPSGRPCSCSRPRTTCAARPRTTSSCSSPCATSGARSSTCYTPTNRTSLARRAGRIGASIATRGSSTGSIAICAPEHAPALASGSRASGSRRARPSGERQLRPLRRELACGGAMTREGRAME